MRTIPRKQLYLITGAVILTGLVLLLVSITGTDGVSDSTHGEGNGTQSKSPKTLATDVNAPTIAEEPSKNVLQKIGGAITGAAADVKDTIISPTVLYNVAFASQAPLGSWDPPYNEACEEASMIMASKYFKGEPLSNDIMSQEIIKQVEWQTKNGYAIDIPAVSVKDILKSYYGVQAELINDPKTGDIEKALSEGKLVIVPAAGRQLGNPNFRTPGPLYHMLVIIGYDSYQKEFITNDPGTRNGKKYRYTYDVLMNAIHDWNGGDVENGKKVIITVSK